MTNKLSSNAAPEPSSPPADTIAGMGLRRLALLTHDRIEDLRWSADGTTLVLGGENGVWSYDPDTPDVQPRQFSGDIRDIKSVTVSPDGGTIAAGGVNGKVYLWNTRASTEPAVLAGHAGPITSVAFNRDGQTLASASQDRTVRLWRLAAPNEQATLTGPATEIDRIAFSPDDRLLAASSILGVPSVQLWDVQTKMASRLAESEFVHSVTFTPDGLRLLTGGEDGVLMIWNLGSGLKEDQIDLGGMVKSIAFSPDGRVLAVGAVHPSSIRLIDFETRRDLAYLEHEGASIEAVAFRPGGTILAVAISNLGTLLLSPESDLNVRFMRDEQEVVSLAVSPDATSVAVGRSDGAVRLVDAATCTATASLDTDTPSPVAFSPDGAMLASTGKGITAQLWDTVTGNKGLVLQGAGSFAEDLAFTPNGSVLGTAGGHEGSVRLWNLATGSEIAVLRPGGGAVHCVRFGADGMLVFGGSIDVHVHYFDAAFRSVFTTTLLRYDGRVRALALSPDGSVIAVGGDSGLRFWRSRGVDRANRPLWSDGTQLRGHSKEILSVAFSHDGKWLASVSADDTVRVWALESATELISLHVARARKMEFFGQHMRSVAFSPDGTLITGDAEGNLGFWRLTTDLLRSE